MHTAHIPRIAHTLFGYYPVSPHGAPSSSIVDNIIYSASASGSFGSSVGAIALARFMQKYIKMRTAAVQILHSSIEFMLFCDLLTLYAITCTEGSGCGELQQSWKEKPSG